VEIDDQGEAPPQFSNCCIGCDIEQDFRSSGSRKSDSAFSAGEAVDPPALSDLEFILGGTILPVPYRGAAEILN
jgi:hypothetical protein